jgi:hypothetical protein
MDGGRTDGSIKTETDLDRGGRTAAAELAEKAESAGVDIEGKTPDEVEEELEGKTPEEVEKELEGKTPEEVKEELEGEE